MVGANKKGGAYEKAHWPVTQNPANATTGKAINAVLINLSDLSIALFLNKIVMIIKSNIPETILI